MRVIYLIHMKSQEDSFWLKGAFMISLIINRTISQTFGSMDRV